MKTKKVLALVVLAAFLISIVPFAAFGAVGDVDVYNSAVEVTEDGNSAVSGTIDGDSDGNEMEVTLVNAKDGGTIYVAASRPDATTFFYEKGDKWIKITDKVASTDSYVINIDTMAIPVTTGSTTKVLNLKVVSTASGTTQIVFGLTATAADSHALSKEWASGSGDNLSRIIDGKHPIEFAAAKAGEIILSVKDFSAADLENVTKQKPANNVDAYTVVANVTTDGGVPVSGKDVTFSITSGTGASLAATRATTNASGKAEVKVYSSKAGTIEVLARVSGLAEQKSTDANGDPRTRTDKIKLTFRSTGIVSVKPESDDNQKVARESDGFKAFRFSSYDAAGTRMDFIKLLNLDTSVTGWSANSREDATDYMKDDVDMKATIVTKPSSSNLKDGDIEFRVHSSGNMEFLVPHDKLNRDGDYEVRVYLVNGVGVSYKFNVKDQGDITKMILSYGSKSYSAGTVMPQPDVKYQDAEGYETSKGLDMTSNSNLKLSISDASFMDGKMDDRTGQFKLKEDKSGVVKMTLVDTEKNLVATQDITIEKAASYLKLTPQSVGSVGGEVTVKIELVDVDGKLAASGVDAESANASVIAKPEGAIASASSVDTADFKKGLASVKVSSNVEGDVTLQVIIVEKEGDVPNSTDKFGGRTYTGAATVSFGKASAGGGQLIFIIGAPSFVSGNQVHAAESPSFIENGRTFLGVRDMGTSIGATVEWDQASQTASLSKDGITVKVTVGASKIAVTKNGVTSEIEIDAPAQNKNGRVYLPFRAVLEAFNYTVTYDQATNSIVCAL